MYSLWILLICGVFSLTSGNNFENPNEIRCKDPSGAAVDWFIAYKLPKIKESSNPFIRAGLGFVFILPGDTDWQLSGQSINDSNSLVGLTLQPLYQELSTKDTAYIAYNDQPPIGPTTDANGHTKGVIITNSRKGIWLQHSVPHFPLMEKQRLHFSYPKTGLNNGQIFHCLSLDVTQVDNVGNILDVTKPHFYNYSIPNDMANALPTLEKVIHNSHNPTDANQFESRATDVNYKLVQIQNSGRTLYSFAKGPSFHEEIYSAWIAPKFQSELDVQSWLNGKNPYPSNCTSDKLKVYNIEDKNIYGNKFSTHNDHSKWAIAIQQPIVCIGDLNRMEHQTKRGGTVNCFTEKAVWKVFKKSIVNTQPCSRTISKVLVSHANKSKREKLYL